MGKVKHLEDLIGLSNLKHLALRDIAACKVAGEIFPHSGFFGPGGLGKSTFAAAIADKLGAYFFVIEGAAIKNRNTLIRCLRESSSKAKQLRKQLVFFIDECHRLGALQEVLYYPMTDYCITTTEGVIRFDPFSVIAATTNPNMLTTSFLTRLQNRWQLDFYSEDQLRTIVAEQLKSHELDYDFFVVCKISQRCLGSPRIAGNLCKKIRNEVFARGGERRVFDRDCLRTFQLEDLDDIGLDRQHIKYLTELFNAQGIPKGIGALAGRLGLDEDVVIGTIEATLLQLGMIDLTSRGRILTKRGHAHLVSTGVV